MANFRAIDDVVITVANNIRTGRKIVLHGRPNVHVVLFVTIISQRA